MTRAFEIKDLESGVDVIYHEDSNYIELHTERSGAVKIVISIDDLLKIFLVAVESGLIDRKEAIIELQTE